MNELSRPADSLGPTPSKQTAPSQLSYYTEDYKPFRSKRELLNRKRLRYFLISFVLVLAACLSAAWFAMRDRNTPVNPHPPVARNVPKISPTVEGMAWRYEEMSDHLKDKGLDFRESGPTFVNGSTIVDGQFHFRNSGRNHWTAMMVNIVQDSSQAITIEQKHVGRCFVWGRFVFSYELSPLTKSAESKRHLESIIAALN